MRKLTLFFLILSTTLFSQTYSWSTIDLNTLTNIRGLSVVNNKVVWVSGSYGWVGFSNNGGKTFTMKQVPGYEKSEFRSLYAFNEKKAIIASTSNPAAILFTNDSGNSWTTVYNSSDTSIFIDGIDFWDDQNGVIYGDPINGKMLLFRTIDGGNHWQEFPDSCRPMMQANESSFAASGTGIRCIDKEKLVLVTGGSRSRMLVSNNRGLRWDSIATSMTAGRSTAGTFSIARNGKNSYVIVGGDFLRDTLKINHVFYTIDGGKNWIAPEIPTRGYRECVELIKKKTLIASGPSGSDISYDNGKNWQPLNDEKSFHVVRKARKGNLIIAAGKGKIAIIK